MAVVKFEDIDFSNSNSNNSKNSVTFFGLKNDGDEAVVRFPYQSVNDFEVLSVHQIQMGNKFRSVNCIRTGRDSIDTCPFCANSIPLRQRFFVTLIQYVKDPATGAITPEAKVWERSTQMAQTLKNYLDNYGPLSDMVCKIIRHGAAGNMQTTYEIIPNLSKQMYPDNVYVADFSALKDYRALGTIVMDKNAVEMNEFIQTGAFPVKSREDNNDVMSTPISQEPQFNFNVAPQQTQYQAAPQQQFTPQAPAYNAPPARQPMPWETSQATNRPVRY